VARNPQAWKRLSEGKPQDFHILSIRKDRVVNPRNQSELEIALVQCPDWVNVIPLTPEGRVILIRQFRFGTWAPTLEVPGGVAEPGESPADTAARELEEETGYRPKQILPAGFVHPNPAFQTNKCHSFVALGCEKVHEGEQDLSEDIAVELRRQDEVPGLIRSGEITHSLVLTAFYLAQLQGLFPAK